MNPGSPEPKAAGANAERNQGKLLRDLGPGLIAGAADDDPSGVATYSIAGAQHGTAFLWSALLTWPLMAAVQMMCARIGMVTGRGLMAVLRHRFPRPVIVLASLALLVANTLNLGADLAAMADAGHLLLGVDRRLLVFAIGAGSAWATLAFPYRRIAAVLKWLCLSLLAYVGTGLLIATDWPALLRVTLVPVLPTDREGWATLVALLGTTISPYLFFWQAGQEVEEEKALGRDLASRAGATRAELAHRAVDITAGTFASNLVMYFIILSTALTLYPAGLRNIETSRQAAEALRPLAGDLAYLFYTLGVLGVGLLAIPTLTASAAYACAETFGWREGLNRPFRRARAFYGVILLASLAGAGMSFLPLPPIKALFYTAILNGVLAPCLLTGILWVAGSRALMHGQPSSRLALLAVGVADVLMIAAVLMMCLG